VPEFRLKPYVLHHPTVNHEYNQHLDVYSESGSSDFNLNDNDAHEQIPMLFVKDKLRKSTMTPHMLAQTDLLSESKHFFVIFLNITTLSFLLNLFF
jgi:hypothetical protein